MSYNHDSENFEMDWVDRQMSYRDGSEAFRNLTRGVCYKMDPPVFKHVIYL